MGIIAAGTAAVGLFLGDTVVGGIAGSILVEGIVLGGMGRVVVVVCRVVSMNFHPVIALG